MGRSLILLALAYLPALIAVLPAPARADVALMLTDNERAALVQALGAALTAQPQNSPMITFLLNRINTAPTVTEKKPAEDKPAENPENKDTKP